MDIYSMTGEFEYPTSSQPVVGYLNPMGKNPGYWSVFSWIQSYTYLSLNCEKIFNVIFLFPRGTKGRYTYLRLDIPLKQAINVHHGVCPLQVVVTFANFIFYAPRIWGLFSSIRSHQIISELQQIFSIFDHYTDLLKFKH